MTLQTIKITTLAVLAAATFTMPSVAALTYSDGDLFVGFRQTNNSASEYAIKLGGAATFRNTTTPITINLGSAFNTDMTAAFGSGWATAGNIFWGFAASRLTGAAPETVRSMYLSEPIGTTPISSSSQSGPVNNIQNFQADWGLQNASAVNSGLVVGSIGSPGDTNSWTNQVGNSFSYSNGAPVEDQFANALNLWRLPQGSNQANVTNEGQFTFNFGTNSLVFTPTGFVAAPIPEPSAALFGAAALGAVVVRRRRAVNA